MGDCLARQQGKQKGLVGDPSGQSRRHAGMLYTGPACLNLSSDHASNPSLSNSYFLEAGMQSRGSCHRSKQRMLHFIRRHLSEPLCVAEACWEAAACTLRRACLASTAVIRLKRSLLTPLGNLIGAPSLLCIHTAHSHSTYCQTRLLSGDKPRGPNICRVTVPRYHGFLAWYPCCTCTLY